MKTFISGIALCLLMSCSLRCQPIQVHFEGTVYDESNAVIKGALVLITRGPSVFNSLKADENGNYNIYLPLNGEYDITVSKPGYVQKKYFVSTMNIPAEKSQLAFAANVADVVLFTWYEGLDYGLFDRPMNLYSYHPEKDNIHYDEDYLKEMKVAVKEFKKMERELLRQAREKAKEKEEQLANGKLKAEKALADKIKEEAKLAYERSLTERLSAGKKAPESKTAGETAHLRPGQADKTAAVSAAAMSKSHPDSRIAALLVAYKPGITEETFQGQGVYIIQRVLVRDEMVWIYCKKIFSWGGVACFRDKEPITETTFEAETKKSQF
jgi:hypothetical protein